MSEGKAQVFPENKVLTLSFNDTYVTGTGWIRKIQPDIYTFHAEFSTKQQVPKWTQLITNLPPLYSSVIKEYGYGNFQYHRNGFVQNAATLESGTSHTVVFTVVSPY